MADPKESPLLSVENVTKRFPGVTALNQVNLNVNRGEVLALIGENGAGKSTLMKILAGVQMPDEGTISVEGQPVVLDSVQASQHHQIALIHQELNLSGNLDVGANIFLGREPSRFGFIDKREERRRVKKVLDRIGMGYSIITPVW